MVAVRSSSGGSDGEALAEPDREGVQSPLPAVGAGAAFAAFACLSGAVDVPAGDVADPEVEQLDRGLVVREVPAVLGDFPELKIDRFDVVRRVDHFADLGTNSRNGMNCVQARS